MKTHQIEFEKDEIPKPPLLQPERGIPPSYWVGIIGTLVIAAIGITVYFNFEPKNLPIAAPFEAEKPPTAVAETPEPEESNLDPHEIAWLQTQLTQAQTFGAKLPANTQLDAAVKAASENQADHTWVVISVDGSEWYADPLYHDSLKRPEKSALTHYKVMATVHPNPTKPTPDFP